MDLEEMKDKFQVRAMVKIIKINVDRMNFNQNILHICYSQESFSEQKYMQLPTFHHWGRKTGVGCKQPQICLPPLPRAARGGGQA
jgi:hypothetical protein